MRQVDADAAVIGGGIIGLACAHELSQRGWRVVVAERDRVGSGAGHVAAGMLAPWGEVESESPALLELALESARLYPEWVRGLEAESGQSCALRTEGHLMLALHRDHAEELERLAAIQRDLGLTARGLTREEVLEREACVSPRVVSGLALPGDTQVDPRRLTSALAAALRARDVEILEGAEAAPLIEGARVRGAETPEAEIRCDVVLIAAGAWSATPWPEAAGPLPLRPVKGQVVRLRGQPLVRHVIRTPDVYLVPRQDGEIVVGATSEEQGFDTRITVGAVMDLLREAWRVVPGIAELELAETSAGLRPALRDHLPAIGATAVEGLFVATGHYRHGILLAPMTARLLAEAMVSASAPSLLAPFSPIRLQAAAAAGKEA